jgi:bacitracin synthase 1
MLKAQENQDFQFENLVDKVVTDRAPDRHPLFDVMFAFQKLAPGQPSTGKTIEECFGDSDGYKYERERQLAKFDLTFTGVATAGGLTFHIQYRSGLFKQETIERFEIYFKNTIRSLLEDPGKKLLEIRMITEREKRQLLVEFNKTNRHRHDPGDKKTHQLFAEQVKRTPHQLAVVFGDEQLTYEALDLSAHQLLRVLKETGVTPDSVLGIMVQPSLEMIIGIMGILKAGGAYLPIDPDYPDERIRYMLTDSGTNILLTTHNLSKKFEKLSIVNCQLLILMVNEIPPNRRRINNLQLKGNNLAYIIYTSGSTGKPKGVTIEHRSLNNLCYWHNLRYCVSSWDRASKYAGFGFDASVWEIFPYLIIGAAIFIIEPTIKLEMDKLNQYFEIHHITISFLPTQIAEQFIKTDNRSLRLLLTGGDKLNTFIKRNYQIANNYGPTENTVVSTSFMVEGMHHNIPIGQPVSNTHIYVLDHYQRLQPMGAAGECCISGHSLARGYLNAPELTREKFVMNPFVKDLSPYIRDNGHHRMYKTGDQVRWLPGGNIEFLGRLDFQVKIRGNRIELGEIESRLLQYEGVKETVVAAKKIAAETTIERQGIDDYLVAYIVPVDKESLSLTRLKNYLSDNLPAYMVPTYFVFLEQIPLTTSGKVDRRALPTPGLSPGKGAAAPGNEIEKKLANLWSSVLGTHGPIGIDDNFFEWGGHSLKATILIAKMHQVFNIKVPLDEIFKRPTIRQLCQYIQTGEQERYVPPEIAEEKEYYPLSSAQKRSYVLYQAHKGSTGYNMPKVVILEGKLEKDKLEETFKQLILRHDIFRTSFQQVKGEPIQRVREKVEFSVERVLLPADKEEYASQFPHHQELRVKSCIKEFIRPFDLSKAPLLRVGLIKIREVEHILIADMHHIISDGTSMDILVREFMALYDGQDLLPCKLQYKDFSEWQHREKAKEAMKKQEAFWLKEFESGIPSLDMHLDYPRPPERSFAGAVIEFELTKEETTALKRITQEEEVTLYMVLLALFNILLYRLSGQEDIVVGTPTAGRQHEELQHTIGMFVSTLALRNYPRGKCTFKEFLKDLRQRTLTAFENQGYPFEVLVEKVVHNMDNSRNPLFDVMFVLQNQEMTELRIPGLKLGPYPFENNTAKFDLTLIAAEKNNTLSFIWQYSTKLFKPGTIKRFIHYFKEIVTSVPEDPMVRLSEIKLSVDLVAAESPIYLEMEEDFGF